MTTPFPISPEELTTHWLSAVLDCQVDAFSVKPLGEGVGILGLVTRVTLQGKACPKTLIAKFQSPVADNRAVAGLYQMYEREITFYTEIAPTLSIRAPSCFHAGYDPDSRAFVLLLEDLDQYEIGDQVAGCSIAQCEQVVKALAKFHAETLRRQRSPRSSDTIMKPKLRACRLGFQPAGRLLKRCFRS